MINNMLLAGLIIYAIISFIFGVSLLIMGLVSHVAARMKG